MRFVSCLCSVFIVASVHLPGALSAAGLYEDFPSFFSAADTTRTRLLMRQAELERGAWRASLLTAEVDFRIGRRFTVRFGFGFPAVRRNHEIQYGIGDIILHGAARLFGDSLDASGLFLRSDVRAPSGAKGLRPFCNASLDGDAGFEVRFTRGVFALRGAALRTLAGTRLHEADFETDNNLMFAASLQMRIPRIVSVTAATCLVRFDRGASREIILCSLGRCLSEQLMLGIEGAIETGTREERVFDSSISVSLAYRFPPPVQPPSRKSGAP